MRLLKLSLGLLLVGTGCPADDAPADTDSGTDTDATTSSSTSTSTSSTTSSTTDPSTSTTDATSTTGPTTVSTSTDASSGSDSGSSGSDSGSGSTGSDSGSGSGSGSSSTGSTEVTYPACNFGDEPPSCLDEDVCVDFLGVNWCSATCDNDPDDCPDPSSGDATPVCVGQGDDRCALDCSDGQTCPDDMDCTQLGNGGNMRCTWPTPE